MFRDLRIAAVIPCYNEAGKIERVVERTRAVGIVDSVLVVDDGSTDDSAARARKAGAKVLRLGSVIGVGAALRAGFLAVKDECDVVVVLAGNNKDEPREIPRLLTPIAEGAADFVQGSRYLEGGNAAGGMPRYRRIATQFHPWFFSRMSGKAISESTNGFRAFHVRLLGDPRLDLDQRWLDGYALEPYLLLQVVRLGYRHTEVPVTKTYPPKGSAFTKMRPWTDWWQILSPGVWLPLGIKR